MNIQYSVVGNGGGSKYEKEMLDTMGGYVTRKGSKVGASLCAEYKQADVCWQPSQNEAFGLAMVEAMSHGCLGVAGYQAAKEVFDKGLESGMYIGGLQVEGQVEKGVGYLEELLANPLLLEEDSLAAYAVARQFDPQKLSKEFANYVLDKK